MQNPVLPFVEGRLEHATIAAGKQPPQKKTEQNNSNNRLDVIFDKKSQLTVDFVSNV